MLHFLPRLLAMLATPVGPRSSKRVKMSECYFDALPREIQLRILREGLITVKDDTHPEPLEGKNRPWGPPPAFQVRALEGAERFGDLIEVPKGIVDGLHDVKIAAQVACLSESMSELTRTGLFEERLAALEAVFDAGCDVELEGTCAQNSQGTHTTLNHRFLRKELKQYIDPRHIDGWSTRSTAEKYRALLNHLNQCYRRTHAEAMAADYTATELERVAAAPDSDDTDNTDKVVLGWFCREVRALTYDYWGLLVGGNKNMPDATEQLTGAGSTG